MGGAAAGLLKGVAICCIILAVLLRYFPEASFIAGSWSAPHLNRISNLLIKYLPDNISQRIPSEFTPKETI